MSYTSFWMAGWLRDVAPMGEASVGRALFVLSLAIVPGYFFSGMIVDLLQRLGVLGGKVLLVYGILFLLMHVALAADIANASTIMWFIYVTLGGSMAVAYLAGERMTWRTPQCAGAPADRPRPFRALLPASAAGRSPPRPDRESGPRSRRLPRPPGSLPRARG